MKILRILVRTALIFPIALVACSDQNGSLSYNGKNGQNGENGQKGEDGGFFGGNGGE